MVRVVFKNEYDSNFYKITIAEHKDKHEGAVLNDKSVTKTIFMNFSGYSNLIAWMLWSIDNQE